MLRLHVAPGHRGPTVVELHRSGLLEGNDRTFEVTWKNTREEQRIIKKHPHVNFVLTVDDLTAMQRSANALGIVPVLPEDTVKDGRSALTSLENSDWKRFSSSVGAGPARSLLIRIAGDAIRKGKHPRKLSRVVSHCLLYGVSAADADVLLGLENV